MVYLIAGSLDRTLSGSRSLDRTLSGSLHRTLADSLDRTLAGSLDRTLVGSLQQMSEYGEHEQYSEFDEDNECGHSFKATSQAL